MLMMTVWGLALAAALLSTSGGAPTPETLAASGCLP